MSYDVWVGDKASFNYTSNTSKVLYDHIPVNESHGGLHEIDGKTGREASVILADAFKRLNDTRHKLYQDHVPGEPAFCAAYDAPNGWGSLVGTIIFMGQILGACAMFPDEIVGLSA